LDKVLVLDYDQGDDNGDGDDDEVGYTNEQDDNDDDGDANVVNDCRDGRGSSQSTYQPTLWALRAFPGGGMVANTSTAGSQPLASFERPLHE
jgi:hypothetical protein